MNPNLFKMQENPDGLEGHIEREEIRKTIDAKDVKTIEYYDVLPSELSAKLQPKFELKQPKSPSKQHQRQKENKRFRKTCEFYDKKCERRNCIHCQTMGVPKANIKNIIEWM
jgi:hypothetical protein